MKKIVVAAFFGLLSVPAMAWVCAKDGWDMAWLDAWIAHSDTLPSSSYNVPYNQPDWSVTANVSNTGVQTVSGTSVCATNSGTYAQTGTPGGSGGTNCWCRMTSPRAGSWVFRGDYDDASFCADACTEDCLGAIAYGVDDFRTAILN